LEAQLGINDHFYAILVVKRKKEHAFVMNFRVRAAAIILNKNNELLLVHHRDPQTGEEWWELPGGGLEGEESAVDAIIREVKEECKIRCIPQRLVYAREFLDCEKDIHHVELFFTAKAEDYQVERGTDPELKKQRIIDVRFLSRHDIKNLPAAVFPEILRDRFWEDLKRDFKGHANYLGRERWR